MTVVGVNSRSEAVEKLTVAITSSCLSIAAGILSGSQYGSCDLSLSVMDLVTCHFQCLCSASAMFEMVAHDTCTQRILYN